MFRFGQHFLKIIFLNAFFLPTFCLAQPQQTWQIAMPSQMRQAAQPPQTWQIVHPSQLSYHYFVPFPPEVPRQFWYALNNLVWSQIFWQEFEEIISWESVYQNVLAHIEEKSVVNEANLRQVVLEIRNLPWIFIGDGDPQNVEEKIFDSIDPYDLLQIILLLEKSDNHHKVDLSFKNMLERYLEQKQRQRHFEYDAVNG